MGDNVGGLHLFFNLPITKVICWIDPICRIVYVRRRLWTELINKLRGHWKAIWWSGLDDNRTCITKSNEIYIHILAEDSKSNVIFVITIKVTIDLMAGFSHKPKKLLTNITSNSIKHHISNVRKIRTWSVNIESSIWAHTVHPKLYW